MSKSKQLLKQWLPLAMVPMMSVAVLQGCSSDDDPIVDNSVVGDSDGNGLADDFEATLTGGLDANGDGIDDKYAVTATGTDTNENLVDDSYEAFLTGGADLDQNGIDDAAAAALEGTGGTDGGTGGTDGGTGGTDGGTGGTDSGTGGTDGGTTGGGTGGSGGTDSGSLGTLNIGDDQGTVNLSWDGSVLSGTVTAADSAGATSAALYQGIAAATADPGIQLLQLNGNAPNFSFPNGLSADQTAPVAAAMASGNLYIVLETSAGQVRSEQMLPPGGAVVPTYTSLTSSSGAFSNGEAYFNINTNTGDYAAYLNVNLNPSDTDSAGDPITISAATINRDSIAGEVMLQLNDTGDSRSFKASGQLSQADLQIITTNNGWFQVYQNDGTIPGPSFLSGQIQSQQP